MSLMAGALSFKAVQTVAVPMPVALVSKYRPIEVSETSSDSRLLDLSRASAEVDPFNRYHTDILALQEAMEGEEDEAADEMMLRWQEIDALALASRPTTIAGAVGALLYAQREYSQFIMGHKEADERSKALVLHLIQGAAAVFSQMDFRQAA